MSKMEQELIEKYRKETEEHADFLCEKVFKPAFNMAFIHGVKHGREDVIKEQENENYHCYAEDFLEEDGWIICYTIGQEGDYIVVSEGELNE